MITKGISQLVRSPRLFEELIRQSFVHLVFITRELQPGGRSPGTVVYQGALVRPEKAAEIDQFYRENVNPDWAEPLTFPIDDFRKYRRHYEEDISRNHIVYISHRGKVIFAWLSNSVLRDLPEYFPDLVTDGLPDWGDLYVI